MFRVSFMDGPVSNKMSPSLSDEVPILQVLPSWKALLLIATLPNLVTIVLYKWVPESPSWLLCNGKTEAAEEILAFMAKANRRDPAVSSQKSPAPQNSADIRATSWLYLCAPMKQ